MFLIFLSSIVFSGVVLLLAKISIDKENTAQIENVSSQYLECLKTGLEKDDDLMLNNMLDLLKKQPGVLKISIGENGRIIADTDANDINTKTEGMPASKYVLDNKKNLQRYDNYMQNGREFTICLQMSKGDFKNRDNLQNNIFITALVYLVVNVCVVVFVSKSGKNTPPIINVPVISATDNEALSFLSGSKTAVVLVLTGDNRILEASTKALEIFGTGIIGKDISELNNFNLITDAIGKGRKPLLMGGKKYLIL